MPRREPSAEEIGRVERNFRFHQPTDDQKERMGVVTTAFKELALFLLRVCPASAELTLAMRDLESARMRANQAIAVNEKADAIVGQAKWDQLSEKHS